MTTSIAEILVWQGRDPLLTEPMAQVERSRRIAIRARLSQCQSEHAGVDEWRDLFERELRELLHHALRDTYRCWDDLLSKGLLGHGYAFFHARRRLVAGLHQELELFRKGEAAYQEALRQGQLIFEGQCVDSDVFHLLYGF